MLLWKVCPRSRMERAFVGEGAIRTSDSCALAMLEHGPGDDLVAVAGELPDGVTWEALESSPELPGLVADWLASGRSAVLSVPSPLSPGDRNLLLNPQHPEAGALVVQRFEPIQLRPRAVLPAIADGSDRKLDPRLIRVQRIGGLLAVAVVAVVSLSGIGIAYVAGGLASLTLALALGGWAVLIATIAGVSLTWPRLAWARAGFRVDGEGLQIRRGVWWREVLRVPRSRVQHTDVSQGPVERSFGLSTLVVHTAGTHHASIHLEGLDLATAEALRDYLIAGTEDAV